MTTQSQASAIIAASETTEQARKAAITSSVDLLVTGCETKAIYEFTDSSLLIIDFEAGKMTAA